MDADGRPHGYGKFKWLVGGNVSENGDVSGEATYDIYEGQWAEGTIRWHAIWLIVQP